MEEIAKKKMPDLNAKDLAGAAEIIRGTAKSMGIEVQG
jgi:large subunit ribosomal protein L11